MFVEQSTPFSEQLNSCFTGPSNQWKDGNKHQTWKHQTSMENKKLNLKLRNFIKKTNALRYYNRI